VRAVSSRDSSAFVVTPARIDGEQIEAVDVIEVCSPWDGRLLGAVPACSARQVDQAVSVALDRHRGPQLPADRRAAILDRVADLLAKRREVFAASISAEAGKPIAAARIEVDQAVDTVRFSGAVARTLAGDVLPLDAGAAGEGRLGFARRVPVGVVGAITPFSFPLSLVCHKVAPAVAASCPVVLKPAPATPLTALAVGALFEEAGLPPGWLNVVTCTNHVAAELATHPGVAMVSFTGSRQVGHGLRAAAPATLVRLELGNNAPVIVEADADWRAAAAKVAVAGFTYAGQTCISVQRLLVHRGVHDAVVDDLVGRVGALQVGDPADDRTEVSSLITPAAAERVAAWVSEAVAQGAVARCGGGLREHSVVAPCVLTGVTPDMRVSHAEVLGPVIGVQAYDDFDEALALANDTRHGLQAAVFTADLGKALLAAEALDFGGVLVNEVPIWDSRGGAAPGMTELRQVVLSA
jgi:acyl-CoA reductase-like NAD-dependent aldehyde dehydrogenase